MASISDPFTGTGALSGWTVTAGTMARASDICSISNPFSNFAFHDTPMDTDDHSATCDFNFAEPGEPLLMVGSDKGGSLGGASYYNGYTCRYFAGWHLYRDSTEVDTAADAVSGWDTVKLEKTSAGAIKVYLNTVEIMSYTDGSPLTGKYVGIGSSFTGFGADCEADNFLASDAGGGATNVAYGFRRRRSGLFVPHAARRGR